VNVLTVELHQRARRTTSVRPQCLTLYAKSGRQLQSSALTLKNLSVGLGKMEMCAKDSVFLEKYQVILTAVDCPLVRRFRDKKAVRLGKIWRSMLQDRKCAYVWRDLYRTKMQRLQM